MEDDGFKYRHHCRIFFIHETILFCVWEKYDAKDEEKGSVLQFICLRFRKHIYTLMFACLQHNKFYMYVADMSSVKQMFLIPKSPLRLPISLTSVCVLSVYASCLFMAGDVCV